MTILGHFTPALPEWTATTLFTAAFGQPSIPTGYIYLPAGAGTTGGSEPTWPTTIGASVLDGSVTWICEGYNAALYQLSQWDVKQAQSINGDLGGCWAPGTTLTLGTSNGGFLNVTGPTVISGFGSLETLSGALVSLDTGDFPQLASNHAGQTRRIRTACLTGVSDQSMAVRPDFALGGLHAVACTLAFYVAGVTPGVGSWAPVAAVAVANLTLSGEQVIDGVVTSASRVLVTGQTSPNNNGLYVTASGSWTRTSDANASGQFVIGEVVAIGGGGVYGGTTWAYNGLANPTLGTSPLSFAIAGDATVSVVPVPVQWELSVRVHDGATLTDATLSFSALLGSPTARIVAVDIAGNIVPLTSTLAGADANGWVMAPAASATSAVQPWSIPIDGGALPSNAVVAVADYAYLLQVQEDQSQAEGSYPYVLPVMTDVVLATTTAIDLANAPGSIDGFASGGGLVVGARVLVKNQSDPTQNGIYLYPGVGLPFAYVASPPIPDWLTGTTYSLGQTVLAAPENGLYYLCTNAGTSYGRAPVWPTIAGATVTEVTGVVWTCQGPAQPGAYVQTVEVRNYGLLQGAVVRVAKGVVNGGAIVQYGGPPIAPDDVGKQAAVPWVTTPTGLTPATTDDVSQSAAGTFTAQGNVYTDVALDHVDIVDQRFQ